MLLVFYDLLNLIYAEIKLQSCEAGPLLLSVILNVIISKWLTKLLPKYYTGQSIKWGGGIIYISLYDQRFTKRRFRLEEGSLSQGLTI